ncbi:hypothetical protein ACVIGB_008433 [Bradyrhizobium sp. USDA 4341]
MALHASIVATDKLNDVNPVAYIALAAIIADHPPKRNRRPQWQFRKTSSQHQ